MAATIRVSYFSGAGPSAASAETGITFGRDELQVSTTPVPIPTAVGTNYSWYKALGLEVTATDTTSIDNRRVRMASGATTGLYLYFQAVVSGSYAQATNANRPADEGTTNGAVPAGYTLMTTSNLPYDDGNAISSGSAGLNGDYCYVVAGIGNNFGGGGGDNALPNLVFVYDES